MGGVTCCFCGSVSVPHVGCALVVVDVVAVVVDVVFGGGWYRYFVFVVVCVVEAYLPTYRPTAHHPFSPGTRCS